MNLSDVRQTLRTKRRALNPAQQRVAAQDLAAIISRQGFFLRAKRVALYLASDGEIDPAPLLDIALNADKPCFLPVIHPLKANRLYFVEYRRGDPLKKNRFGILEPLLGTSTVAPVWSLDVVFLPLVGFDRSGNRIGMGGGFYDRTLANSTLQNRHPLLVGLAHSCQQMDAIEHQTWDIPLQKIATDQEIICAKQK